MSLFLVASEIDVSPLPNMNISMIKSIALLAALSLCTLASAKPPSQLATLKTTAAAFVTLDRNADDRLSKTEAGPDRKLADLFAYVDTNGDGFISRDEYLAVNRQSAEAG